MTEPTSAVEQQVQARIAAARRRIEQQRKTRAAFAAARAKGLARRHAAKLKHQPRPIPTQAAPTHGEGPGLPTPGASTAPDPSPMDQGKPIADAYDNGT